MYFSAPYIDPTNDKRVWELGVTIFKSEDGGATFENMPNSPAYDVGLKTDHHMCGSTRAIRVTRSSAGTAACTS
jgi:hypothetical protein